MRALLRAERVRLATSAAACRFRCFFSWLLRVLRALDAQGGGADPQQQQQQEPPAGGAAPPPEQMRDIRALLRGQLAHDAIGPELSTDPLDPDEAARSEAALRGAIAPGEAERLLALLFPCRPPPRDAVIDAALARDQRRRADGADGVAAAGLEEEPRDAEADAAAARARPLMGMLQHLEEACEAAFERPQAVVSAAMARTLQLRLAPAAALAVAAGGGGDGDGDGRDVRVASAAAAEGGVWFACILPGSNGDQGQQVLVVKQQQQEEEEQLEEERQQRRRRQLHDAGNGAEEERWAACLVTLPPGRALVDAALYKAPQLALLTRRAEAGDAEAGNDSSGGDDGGSNGGSGTELALVDLADAPFVELSAAPGAPSALELCLAAGAAVCASALPARRRSLGAGAVAPLAVSRERGLACVVSDVLRAAVLDLEDDDEVAEEDEEEEEEEEEGDEEEEDGMET